MTPKTIVIYKYQHQPTRLDSPHSHNQPTTTTQQKQRMNSKRKTNKYKTLLRAFYILSIHSLLWYKLFRAASYFNSLRVVTPGNSRPSSNSREAPPPVETWLTLSSVPYLAAQVAVSPPPIIVMAPF